MDFAYLPNSSMGGGEGWKDRNNKENLLKFLITLKVS